MGTILLAGGGEFKGQMAQPDREAIEMAGGPNASIRIVPTAAAPGNNHERAGRNGIDWFESLGATDVTSLPIIDSASADDPAISEELLEARLIYLLGGSPRYLAETLSGSRSWRSILSALQTGAVLAGSSAGAMVICDDYFDPGASRVLEGLRILERICILPHHDTFGKTWASPLTKLLPNSVLAGIDEETAVVCDQADGHGRVLGKGRLTTYREGQTYAYGPNEAFHLAHLNIS